MPGSGYRRPPALVRRGDGQVLTLTPLLQQVFAAVDGRRTVAEVAEQVSASYGRAVRPGRRPHLVDTTLRPLGLLQTADGSEPEVRRADPLLALRFKKVATDPAVTRRLTAPFAALFHPLVVVPVVLAFVAVAAWVLFSQGLAAATAQAFANPALFLAVVVRDRAVGRLPRVRPRRRRALRRVHARRHGLRHLPLLAGLLHRRHRQLPARPRRARAHRPRRAVLQRARGAAVLRRLVADRLARRPADRGHAGAADDPAAHADAALRRLPRARRRHRRARPLPADRPGAAAGCCPGAGTSPRRRR